jgi:hypothetical protein
MVYELNPIIIKGNSNEEKTTKKLKFSGRMNTQIIPCQTNISTMVEPKTGVINKKISSASLEYKRNTGLSREKRESYKSLRLLVSLNIHHKSKTNNSFDLIYESMLKNINTGKNDLFELDLSDS